MTNEVSSPVFAGLASIQIGNVICRRLCCPDKLFDSAGLMEEIEKVIIERYEANPPRTATGPVLDESYYLARQAEGHRIADRILSGRPLIDVEECHLEEARERELEGSQFGLGA